MTGCPACSKLNSDEIRQCGCGFAFYRRSPAKVVLLSFAGGLLGLATGWYGGNWLACPGPGHDICGLTALITAPLGALAGAIPGGMVGWFWRSRISA